jgi:glutaredoxin-related protein
MNWGKSLGGVSFPLLADFHPKGAMASSYGLYLKDKGITDRATVVVDANGVVQHASSVTPAGRRNISDLAALCETVDKNFGKKLPEMPKGRGVGTGAKIFVKSSCGFSRAALLARDNLHLSEKIPSVNVSENASAKKELKKVAGTDQAPCLVAGGDVIQDSKDIVTYLVERTTGIWS